VPSISAPLLKMAKLTTLPAPVSGDGGVDVCSIR
jgi:hypothetical protein